MTHLVERLREVFKERRYGAGAEYHPDFDLFDAAADEIAKLRRTLHDASLDLTVLIEAAKSVGNPGLADSVSKFRAKIDAALS